MVYEDRSVGGEDKRSEQWHTHTDGLFNASFILRYVLWHCGKWTLQLLYLTRYNFINFTEKLRHLCLMYFFWRSSATFYPIFLERVMIMISLFCLSVFAPLITSEKEKFYEIQ
jgi:hypothetical protein